MLGAMKVFNPNFRHESEAAVPGGCPALKTNQAARRPGRLDCVKERQLLVAVSSHGDE